MATATLTLNPLSGLSAVSVLGGKKILHILPSSALEWISLVRKGISSDAIDAAVRVMGMGQAELARALDIPERTLARRKNEGILSRDESGKLVRLARVVERAAEVFEEGPTALDWLKTANASLGGATPVSLLDTDLGAMAVFNTLGRIEHGVFA
jgi:putative toxin-antitoxin system antitoxin component (TIGR02293 family)